MTIRLLAVGILVLGMGLFYAVTVTGQEAVLDGGSGAPQPLQSRSYPGWVQVNESGFGDASNAIYALAIFNNQMYAATGSDTGPQIWQTPDGTAWTPATPSAAGWASNTAALCATAFGGRLYVGTWNDNGGELWRTAPTGWERVAQGGSGDASKTAINALAVFGSNLYAVATGLGASFTGTDVKIWRSSTGNAGSWTQVATGGVAAGNVFPDVTTDVFGGYLYLGLSRNGVAELWRTNNGTTWTPAFTNGLGMASNSYVASMAEFGGHLYVGTRNTATGGQVWKSSNGLNWTAVFTDGLGNVKNRGVYGLLVFNNKLYAVLPNVQTGAEVWRTANGTAWEAVARDGWGSAEVNFAAYFDKGATVFKNRLYIAAFTGPSGAEVWKKTVTADFKANPLVGPPPLLVSFGNLSIGDCTSSQWRFGDGASSTLTEPTHLYTAIGAYTVTLTVGDGVDTSTITRTNYIRVEYRVYLPLIMAGY